MSCKQESYTFGVVSQSATVHVLHMGFALGSEIVLMLELLHASGSWNDKQIDLLPMVQNLKTTIGWNSACEGNQSSSKTVFKSCTILLALSLFFHVI